MVAPRTFLTCMDALLLSACLLSRDGYGTYAVRGPDGTLHYSVSCQRTEDCWQEAGYLCPRGYWIVDKDSTISTARRGRDIVQEHNMLVRCR